MKVEASSEVPTPPILKKSSKRFLFDRRYGYVYDDWIQPSEVALAYGRGMFCIVPLGKALFTMVSESWLKSLDEGINLNVNFAARRTIEVLEQPDRITSQSLQKVNDLNTQLHQVMFSMKNMQSNHLKVNAISYQRP